MTMNMQGMALDSRSLENLKQSAAKGANSEEFNEAIEQTARQFEAVFCSGR
ncbi:MAG: hypothetical protein HC848_01080 [Limnobacter sp.]|nr:hypothetical protein [Limnobacter sp.]